MCLLRIPHHFAHVARESRQVQLLYDFGIDSSFDNDGNRALIKNPQCHNRAKQYLCLLPLHSRPCQSRDYHHSLWNGCRYTLPRKSFRRHSYALALRSSPSGGGRRTKTYVWNEPWIIFVSPSHIHDLYIHSFQRVSSMPVWLFVSIAFLYYLPPMHYSWSFSTRPGPSFILSLASLVWVSNLKNTHLRAPSNIASVLRWCVRSEWLDRREKLHHLGGAAGYRK